MEIHCLDCDVALNGAALELGGMAWLVEHAGHELRSTGERATAPRVWKSASRPAFRFFAPGIPATKGSWRAVRGRGAFGKPVLLADNTREKPWAFAVAWSAKAARVRPLDGALAVTIVCWFPRPKKPANPFPARNDVDKLARSVLDALTGIAWRDDEQVVSLTVSKKYLDATFPLPPRARAWGEPGAWIDIARASAPHDAAEGARG